MRTQTSMLFSLFILLLTGVSCSKKDDLKTSTLKEQVQIDEQNLTPCPDKSSCQFLYTENADIDPVKSFVKTGSQRVFWSSIKGGDGENTLYIKAPMKGNSFSLSKEDIIAGSVRLERSCVACLMIPVKPAGGYVKGLNLDPGKRADQARWIVDAVVIMEAIDNPSYQYTLAVKQYYYPNFVYN